jgi:serine/threonine-protein phosphatase 5
MATPEEQAIVFKTEGNKAFAGHNWEKAIEFYSKAIELNDKEPTYWANRAAVRTPRCLASAS